VGTEPVNLAPTISSQPRGIASLGTVYQYQVVAQDPENSVLTYALVNGPTGMVIDAVTGLVTWNSPIAGSNQVIVSVTDADGFGVAQGFTLTTRANAAPTISSTSPTRVLVGGTYRYDVVARDLDGDALTYKLDQASLQMGMRIDNLGRIAWQPGLTQMGTRPVTVTVTDAVGASVNQTFNLAVTGDNLAPVVNLVRSTNVTNVNTTVSFQVQATDNVGIRSRQLFVNDVAVDLTTNNVGSYRVTAVGVITARAVVTDVNGNVTTKTTTVNVLDPTDLDAPAISLQLPTGNIGNLIDIVGTVTDTNLDYYVLQVAPVGTNTFTEVFRGTANVTNGVLGKFDPTNLQNDIYTLRLVAVDVNGKSSTLDQEINVSGELKLGNFRLSFTDISIPVTGIPINLTRTYDTLTSNNRDDFGYGWRMEFRDTDLRTSLKRDVSFETYDIRTVGFQDGDRVYITLPGGKREGFTFRAVPLMSDFNSVLGGRFYAPSFVADKGNTSTLTVPGAEYKNNTATNSFANGSSGNPNNILIRNAEGQLVNLGQRLFRPEDEGFGNRYLLTSKDGTVYEINATNGDLETVTDTNGNKLTYSDTEISSSNGQKVVFARDAQGRIVSVTDPLGEKVTYSYDAKGDLVGVTDRQGNITRYEYNAGRAHYLDKIIDPLGREAVKTEYDEKGRLKKTTNAGGAGVEFTYDSANSIQIVRDALGNATTYEYDARGNILTEVDAVGKITKSTYDDDNNMLSETVISDRSGPAGFKTTYTYDRNRNRLSETDAQGNTTYYSYGAKGRLLTTTDPLGRTTTNSYDSRGNLIGTRDAIGNTTSFGYDSRGQVTQTTDVQGNTTLFSYDNSGNIARIVDSLGYATNYTYNGRGDRLTETKVLTTATGLQTSITRWVYDSEGRMTSTTNALGQTTQYEYNKLGKQIAVIDALGRKTQYVYNDKAELIETIYADDTPATLADNARTRTEYDLDGREIVSIDKAGRITRTVYDAVGQVVEVIAPDTTPIDLTDNPRTRTEYYSDGLVKASIDERGNRTEYRYDSLGRQIEAIYADTTPNDLTDNPTTRYQYNQGGQQISATDALNHTTRYLYDNLGRMVKMIYADNTFTTMTYDSLGRKLTATDQNGIVTEYRYDAIGKLTGVKNALGDWTNYAYSQEGSLLSTIDANGHSTSYEYDLLGRRTSTILSLGQRSLTSYDLVGNISRSVDFNGRATTYKYDAENRLIEQDFANDPTVTMTYTVNDLISTITDGRGVTRFSYDVQNRLLSRTDVDGAWISYGYDIAGNRTSVTTQIVGGSASTTAYSFDERNRLDKVLSGGTVLADYDYDVANRLVKTTLSNGVVETRQYDSLNHLLNLRSVKGTNILTDFTYTLDKAGNRQQVIEAIGSNTRTVNYTYDALYRLLKEQVADATNGNRVTEFVYDKVGNRQQQKVTTDAVLTTTYQYDGNDRLLKEQVDGVDKVVYTYDDNGNTLSKTESGKTTESIWNDQNRLSAAIIKDAAGVVTQRVGYEYDSSGIRVSQNVDGEITKFLVDANLPYAQVLVEYRPSGLAIVSYTHGNDLISQNRNGESSFYHVDGLGSTRALSDTSGNLINTYNYQAFGELLNSTGVSQNKYLFTGEQFDSVLGDYYNRARYYSPAIGRFTKVDTFEGHRTNPITLHDYLYANSNPVGYVDPSGFSSLSEQVAAMDVWNILQTGYRISNGFLGTLDKVNTVVNIVQSLQALFSIASGSGISLNVTTPIAHLSAVSTTNFIEDAMLALTEQIPTITRVVLTKQVVAEGKNILSYWNSPTSTYAFFAPSFINIPIAVQGSFPGLNKKVSHKQ
jgi:RHS repeat-associated protein